MTLGPDVATIRNAIMNVPGNTTQRLNYTGVTDLDDPSDVNLDGRVQISLTGGRGSDSAIVNKVLMQYSNNAQGFLNYELYRNLPSGG